MRLTLFRVIFTCSFLMVSTDFVGDYSDLHMTVTPYMDTEYYLTYVSREDMGDSIVTIQPNTNLLISEWVLPESRILSVPVWSPKGDLIAYNIMRNGLRTTQITTIKSEGFDPLNITDLNVTNSVIWSQSEETILLEGITIDDPLNPEIFTLSLVTGSLTNVSKNTATDYWASWSREETLVAFVSTRDGDPDIFVMKTDGSETRNVSQNDVVDDMPSWSPTSDLLAYLSIQDNLRTILITNTQDTTVAVLRGFCCNVLNYSWSPTGNQIAFTAGDGLKSQIYITNLIDNTIEQISFSTEGLNTLPAWSPDETTIAFQSNSDGDFDILLFDLQTKIIKWITKNSHDDIYPSWVVSN